MTAPVPKSDWKKFLKLREVALERFCTQTLQEVEKLAADHSSNAHQRYLKIYELLQERDRDLARMFDSPRRSQMLLQLGGMYALGLLEAGELEEFTRETRDRLAFFSSS